MSAALEQKIVVTVILADDIELIRKTLYAKARSVFKYPDPRVQINIEVAANPKGIMQKFEEAKGTTAMLIIDNAMPEDHQGEEVATNFRKHFTQEQLPIYLYTSTPPEDASTRKLFNEIFGTKNIAREEWDKLSKQFRQIVETRLKIAGITPIRLASPTLPGTPSDNRPVSASPDSQSRSTVSEGSTPSVLLTPPPAGHKDDKHSERKHELKRSASASPSFKTSGTLSGGLNVTSPSPGPELPPASIKDSKVSAKDKIHTLTIKEEEEEQEKKAKTGFTNHNHNHNKSKVMGKSESGT